MDYHFLMTKRSATEIGDVAWCFDCSQDKKYTESQKREPKISRFSGRFGYDRNQVAKCIMVDV